MSDDTTTDTAEPRVTHRVWSFPLTNGSKRNVPGAVLYSQAVVRCDCGWYTICIAELRDTFGGGHYREHGITVAGPIPYGEVVWS